MRRWTPLLFVLVGIGALALPSCSPTPYQGNSDEKRSRRKGQTIENRTTRCERYLPLLEAASQKYDLDIGLLVGVIRVESHFNPRAQSRVGARGLMQVMPSTGKGMGCSRLYEPASNIDCGAKVLRKFLDRYNDHWVYGLSAYNGGYALASAPHREAHIPRNFRYVEKVLAARSRYLRKGCAGVAP